MHKRHVLTDGGAVNSEAVMTNSGTNTRVQTTGMGMRKNVTIVVPDGDQDLGGSDPGDTYTVAATDHIIMICNTNRTDGAANVAQRIQRVQLRNKHNLCW